MDPNFLPECSRLAPVKLDPSLTPREARAYEQFTREYAEQTRMTRDALRGSAK